MRLLTCLLPQKKQSEIAGIPEGWPHSELASIEKAAAKSHRKNENPAAHVRPRPPEHPGKHPVDSSWRFSYIPCSPVQPFRAVRATR
jgi:hypothetical protein